MDKRRWVFAFALLSACAAEPESEEPVPQDDAVDPTKADAPEIADRVLRIPTTLRNECAGLSKLSAPPAGFTVRDYFDCMSDESRQKLAAAYQRRAARTGGTAPADLPALLAAYGDRRVADGRLRDMVFNGGFPRDERGAGVAPPAARLLGASSGNWGLDPTTCSKSCLSVSVPVVGGSRKIGYSPAWTGAEPAPGDGRRLLDEIDPGSFPDYKQANLANDELVDSGCGPTSALNLFEWWNIPVYDGSTRLTSQDARTNYIAERMHTLDGINFTDDDDLIDFVVNYRTELYHAGRISGYPGYHYMIDDPAAWKVMLSYIARGYPVIALYSTGPEGMHWALITGYTNGKLRIANATDRTLADFYAQWHDWAALSWYADWATDLFVDPDTFIAYTGWGGDGRPDPDRFASRSYGAKPPGYVSGSDVYDFRYCVTALDTIGLEAESLPIPFWGAEPSLALPGYCLFSGHRAGLTLAGSSTVSSGKRILAVSSTSALTSFVAANPGVRCEFNGYDASGWHKLAGKKCSDAGALKYSYTNDGRYSKVEFHVHSPDLARITWNTP